jgi:hypothetical protein
MSRRSRRHDPGLGPQHTGMGHLLKMATDDNVSDNVKLAAIRDALDRGGVGINAEIELSTKPYETVFEQIEMDRGGSRAAHRAGITAGNQHALPAAIDAEIVNDDELGLDDSNADDFDDGSQPDPHQTAGNVAQRSTQRLRIHRSPRRRHLMA